MYPISSCSACRATLLPLRVLIAGFLSVEPACPRCDAVPGEVVRAYRASPGDPPVRLHGDPTESTLGPPPWSPSACPECDRSRSWCLGSDGDWDPLCIECLLARGAVVLTPDGRPT